VSPTTQSYVQVDLSSLPASPTIVKATMTIFVNDRQAAGELRFSQVTSNWSEGTLTFTTTPTAKAFFAAVAAPVADTYVSVDVTALVQMWSAASASNDGILIQSDGSANVMLDSKESAATSHPAILDIELSTGGPEGPAGAVGPEGPAGPAGAKGAAGPTGPIGPQGIQGLTGLSGPQGLQGPNGF
jgi:hypothetical protein